MSLNFLDRFHLNLGLKRRFLRNPLTNALVATFLVPKRLILPSIPLSRIVDAESSVTSAILPCNEWDTPTHDLVALCALSKIRPRARILEIGTCRGRATVQLALNNPSAQIVTYDIDSTAGEYFKNLSLRSRIELRVCDFVKDLAKLKSEPKFDFVFIDASHRFEIIKAHSELAFELLSGGGMIVWHDYCNSGWLLGDNRVPEYLHELAVKLPICALTGTNVAFYPAPIN